MNWTMIDTWIVAAGALCAMSCALLGCFLVLRKMSLMGDAISHAVLPGLVIAFMVTGSRGSLPMFIGAVIVGILTALLTEWVHGLGKVNAGAAMGVVFTILFALGLVLLRQYANAIDLDPDCVLNGQMEAIPMSLLEGHDIPPQVVRLAIVFAVNLAAVVLLYKELKLSSFDPDLATTLGINARLMHYILMALVAVTTVASFESVGSILVIAMLIVPAAAAHLLTDRLWVMLVFSTLLGLAAAALGHLSAITLPRLIGFEDTSTSGMMAVVAGLILVAAVFLAPRHGIISRILRRARLSLRILHEDTLAWLYRQEETIAEAAALALPIVVAPRSAPARRLSLVYLGWRGLVQRSGSAPRLTEQGRRAAVALIRAHRLWESYLSRHGEAPPDHFHPAAEQLEHVTDPALRDRLDTESQRPATDPQGKRIPEA